MFAVPRRRPVRATRRLTLEPLDERTLPAAPIDTATLLLSNGGLNENAWGGALVGTFTPHIPGAAGYTSYQLAAGAGDTNNNLFYVAGNQLRARQSFDHETQPTLSIHVRATAANGVSSEEQFTITVADVNERPTALTLAGQAVAENSPAGTLVGTLGAVDPDAGDTLTYALIGNAGGRFQVNGDRLEVAPGADLNFEQQRSFYVRARATDSGGKSVYRGFHITLTNVPEAPAAPVLYSSTVWENSPAGTFVGQVAATDPDGPAPTLSLTDDAGGRFRLTGDRLEVNGPIDYESAPSYNVTVRAADADGLFADSTFAITVVNANEAPTDLTLSGSSVSLPAATGSLVGTLGATDPDAGATLRYLLTDNAGGKFRITGDRLEVADPTLFRWDPRPTYPVTVLGQDEFGLGVSNTFTIAVTATPAGPSDITLNGNPIPENSPTGQYVGYVSATDPDSFAPPTLTLVDDAAGRFQLVGQFLRVKDGSLLDYEQATSHQVTIRATDADGLWIDRTFTIAVTNVNEAPTAISLSAPLLTLPPTAGQVIGTLSATDPDGPSGLTFILTDNASGKFAIQNGTEVVVTDPNLFVWDPQPGYTIKVMVLDAFGGVFEQAFPIMPAGGV